MCDTQNGRKIAVQQINMNFTCYSKSNLELIKQNGTINIQTIRLKQMIQKL